jgi:acetoin utilization deacetylase AcuC-like enzyme
MAIVYHEHYLDHYQDTYHPESPERLVAIRRKLKEEDLLSDVLTPEPATEDDLETIHTREHIDFIKSAGEGRLDMDTQSHEETYEIALLACGGAILAADTSFSQEKPAMALLRPPGHHAGPDYSGGFCYFNNIALAAQHLREKVDRVAVVDIDVHHGNGTSDIFSKRSDILYISTHQWGIFPGTGPITYAGEGAGEGYTVNLPFTGRCGDTTYVKAFDEIVEPVTNQFRPEALLVSLGGDAHYMDPLATLSLSSHGYITLADRLYEMAKTNCKGRISFYLEGGYHTRALAEIVAGIMGRFADKNLAIEFSKVYDGHLFGADIIERVKEIHSSYWKI